MLSEFIEFLAVIQFLVKERMNQKNLIDLETDSESHSMDMDSCSIPCLLKLFQMESFFQQLSERSCRYEICLAGFYHGKNRFYLGYKLFNRRSNMILAIAL